jgi:hypothetical protein
MFGIFETAFAECTIFCIICKHIYYLSSHLSIVSVWYEDSIDSRSYTISQSCDIIPDHREPIRIALDHHESVSLLLRWDEHTSGRREYASIVIHREEPVEYDTISDSEIMSEAMQTIYISSILSIADDMEFRIRWDMLECLMVCSDSMIRTLDSSEPPDEYDVMCLGVSID